MQLSLLFEGPGVPERPSENSNPNPNPNPKPNANPNSNKNENSNGNQNAEPRTLNPERVLFVRHPRARRYVLRVADDGTVRVTIPRWGSRREAQQFAREQGGWIERQLRRIAAERERPRPPELSRTEMRPLIARAKRELPERLLQLAGAHRLTVTRISIRNQRWRWGSCNRKGHICLNWRLVTMPEWVRDYVLIHELMHLVRLDHSPKFWKLVAAACPNYQDARRWLRDKRNESAELP
ncbi:MAG TPA: SprT family zinc-dependent metalloprotease [Vicinamibacterales bacterium]|nr:SprT family zinc-dependent metalloprotease [Vicinamibacterales bacterium]